MDRRVVGGRDVITNFKVVMNFPHTVVCTHCRSVIGGAQGWVGETSRSEPLPVDGEARVVMPYLCGTCFETTVVEAHTTLRTRLRPLPVPVRTHSQAQR